MADIINPRWRGEMRFVRVVVTTHWSGLKMKRRLCHTKQVARMRRAKQDIKFGQRCSTSSASVNLHAGGPTLSTGIFD
jgi:hypothetical protein